MKKKQPQGHGHMPAHLVGPHPHAGVFAHGGEDMHPFLPPLEPGDPGPRALEKIKPPAFSAYLPKRQVPITPEAAKNPSPHGSFGYVDRFVKLQAEREGDFPPGTLVIALDPGRFGTVAPETLRVFHWSKVENAYTLVQASGLGQTRDYVWAQVARPGTYAVIGVDADPLIARTIGLLDYFEGWLAAGNRRERRRFHKRICELILCAPDMHQRVKNPEMARKLIEENLKQGLPGSHWPGGVPATRHGGNPCELCLGLDIPLPGHGKKIPDFRGKRPPEIEILLPWCRDTPAKIGRWNVLPYGRKGTQILAVHAALLRTGKVLYFSGDEHDPGQNAASKVDHSRLWNPATGAIQKIGSPKHDLFCSGHAFLGNGRLLVAGGTEKWGGGAAGGIHGALGHFTGLRNAKRFNPAFASGTNPWGSAASMKPERGKATGGGRWYPSLLTLPNGRILAMSGHPVATDTRPQHNNIMIETYNPASNSWRDEGDQILAPDSYPRLHVRPDGQVFCTRLKDGNSWKWNPATKAWSKVASGPGSDYSDIDTASVLLPLLPGKGHQARVLVVGATQAKTIDLSAGTPVWKNTSPRKLSGSPRRRNGCAVLLPDGTVLVVGGSRTNFNSDAVLTAERYNPATGQWSNLATAAVPRLYHSVALLLPDGRVWTAGSNYNCGRSFPAYPSLVPDHRELRMEVYSPPYLFRGPRPTIASAPASLNPPANFNIGTPQAAGIRSVALVRCGSVTHAFDSDQRYVGLAIKSRTSTRLRVASPPNRRIAPPGYYLLFVVDNYGVPSVGRFVRIA